VRIGEFFDKERGTRDALIGPTMDDSDRNIMRELAGEADEPCVKCGVMLRPDVFTNRTEFSLDEDGEEPVCEDCYEDARDVYEDAKAEAQRERRLAESEARFNARWPR
jgi:hypothetical protein